MRFGLFRPVFPGEYDRNRLKIVFFCTHHSKENANLLTGNPDTVNQSVMPLINAKIHIPPAIFSFSPSSARLPILIYHYITFWEGFGGSGWICWIHIPGFKT
jgi:hypothetical protein